MWDVKGETREAERSEVPPWRDKIPLLRGVPRSGGVCKFER